MKEIDKACFGVFVQELRKEKGLTQLELAEKLYVSDKAVSKWERGLSLPDVTLLLPLAEALDVTVTELLEGRRMAPSTPMEPEAVETLVQRALTIPQARRFSAKNALIFVLCVLLAAGEIALLLMLGHSWEELGGSAGLVTLLCAAFGAYFWLFAPQRLSAYYDENRINCFVDGPLRMNIPGLAFNNRNWPHIVSAVRVSLTAIMLGYPLVYALLSLWIHNPLVFLPVTLGVIFGGLFIPIYAVGKKYE